MENLSVGKHILTISSGPTGEKNYTVDVVPYLTTNKFYANTSDLTFKSSTDLNGDLTVSCIVNTKVKVENGTASIPVPPFGSDPYKTNITYENLF